MLGTLKFGIESFSQHLIMETTINSEGASLSAAKTYAKATATELGQSGFELIDWVNTEGR
jgi:hypothetical protein